MEAAMFSARIYDGLKLFALELLVALPARLDAISKAKHSTGPIDTRVIAGRVRSGRIPGA